MTRLIHLNGAPGTGKSTVAGRWALDRPGALVVEIDQLRTQLAGWQSDESSKLLAREVAIGLIGNHLAGGDDVIVPQYLGRLPFIERLSGLASDHDAVFVEIMLTADQATALSRFRRRQGEATTDSPAHPASEVHDRDAPAVVDDALARLDELLGSRPGIVVIDATATADEVHQALCDALVDDQ